MPPVLGYTHILHFADHNPRSGKNYAGAGAKGFVETSRDVNRTFTLPVKIHESGRYVLSLHYTNGNGPINTENKCAIRTLHIKGGQKLGTFVLPQRGVDEWSNWGQSNVIIATLPKGEHTLEITFDPENKNMNGAINQAMIESLQLTRIP